MKKGTYDEALISTMTLLEVLRGIDDDKRPRVTQLIEESYSVIDIDNSVIHTYCKIYRQLKEKGNVLADADLIIAATAIAHNLVLETKDAHFLRLEPFGLKLKKRV